MKILFTSIFTLVLALFVLFALPASGEEAVYTDTLRLHVLAASDSTADQEAKLAVRDAILSAYGEELAACTDKASAVAVPGHQYNAVPAPFVRWPHCGLLEQLATLARIGSQATAQCQGERNERHLRRLFY